MRTPNPWVGVPSLLGGLIAAFVAWVVTDVSCREQVAPGVVEGCPGVATVVALLTFALTTFALAVVIVLVFRSLAEYRETTRPGEGDR